MKYLSLDDSQEVLRLHALWLAGDESGARANLRNANLRNASLIEANLRGANLSGANLARANLRGASLIDANLSGAKLIDAKLSGASLARADLCGASGNLREIKTAAFDKWSCAWTMSPEGQSILQIGCQRHPLAKWKDADDRWIDKLDRGALAWWKRYGKLIIKLVETSPATPWGKGVEG